MILLFLAVSVVPVSSEVKYVSECDGSSLRIPSDYMPPFFGGQLYFTPSRGGGTKLMIDGGELKDPRLELSYSSLRLKDLTRRDDGTFSVSFNENRRYDVIKLTINDCADGVTKIYGERYYHGIPRKAEFLEFVPSKDLDQSYVLWNRSDPQAIKRGRGQVRGNTWEMDDITQADNGYYNFRKRDRVLLTRILLSVKERSSHYDTKVGKELQIKQRPVWTVIFTPKGQKERYTVMEAGHVVSDFSYFMDRMWGVYEGIKISPVESTDSGTFDFIDKNGNLAATVKVEVEQELALVYVVVIAAAAGAVALCLCCCCLRKRSTPQSAPAPAVYCHDKNKPAEQSSSTAPPTSASSYQLVRPRMSTEPTSTFAGSSVYSPVNVHVNPPRPEAAAPGGQGAAPAPSLTSDWLSSGPEPTFNLKGTIVPSAPPLTSDSAISYVYTSDKLNFL